MTNGKDILCVEFCNTSHNPKRADEEKVPFEDIPFVSQELLVK